MSLPSTVTQRAQGNTYIGNTGMEIAVQTGFAIRTGFYITNSGNSSMEMDLDYISTKYDAFDFLSGLNEPVTIPAGSSRLIGFDFYGLKDSSGPDLAATGPLGTGAYTATLNLSFTATQNNEEDETFYSGPQPLGRIRVGVTGYVTGTLYDTTEFTPSHPSGFLVKSGLYSGDGSPYQELKWSHPSTGYYYEEIEIQYSDDDTATWDSLTDISLEDTEFSTVVDGTTINTYYYGTPTGIVGYDSYTNLSLDFNTSYYYRLRGNHYDRNNTSSPLTSSDWVYGYPVSDFEQDISNNDILTGLTSGSTTLGAATNPSGVINANTNDRQAIKIFLEDREENVNLNTKFDLELTARSIDNTYLDPTHANYNFTGVHFILPSDYTVGSVNDSEAAIETGDILEDASSNEVKSLLVLKANCLVAGKGGNGGNGGYARIEDLADFTSQTHAPRLTVRSVEEGTDGSTGGPAIKITDSSISEFEIWADSTSRIYGGGGGGGGGDVFFHNKIFSDFIKDAKNRQGSFGRISSDSLDGIAYGVLNNSSIQNASLQKIEENNWSFISKQNIVGKAHGGAGGGGQGFTSQGGIHLGLKNAILENGKGSLEGYGIGATANLEKRIGSGGNGGVFGQKGETPNPISSSNISIPDPNPYEGGEAGYAIDSSVNANYTVSNFRDNLFFISKKVLVENINGFLAHWDASEDVYNDAGSTLATNGQTVHTWNPKNSHTSLSPSLLGGSTKPIYQTSSSYFNGNPYVRWSGSDMSASFSDIVGSSPRLRGEMQGFEIFYNILPFDPVGTSQFLGDNNHNNTDYILHKWSENGQNEQFNSYFYSENKKIVENAGIANHNMSFFDSNYNTSSLRKPSSSFVYNISVKEIITDVIEYKIYQNQSLIYSNIFRNKFISFIDNPILGNYLSGAKEMSFALSDIIVFNRKLNQTERDSVNSILISKNRTIKTTTSAGLNDEANRNIIDNKNGFAGFVLMNS